MANKKTGKPNKIHQTFRLDPGYLDKAKEIAKSENRTICNFHETAVKKYIDEKLTPQ